MKNFETKRRCGAQPNNINAMKTGKYASERLKEAKRTTEYYRLARLSLILLQGD